MDSEERVQPGDIVRDNVTGYRGTVRRTYKEYALVEIDPLYLKHGADNEWILLLENLTRLWAKEE